MAKKTKKKATTKGKAGATAIDRAMTVVKDAMKDSDAIVPLSEEDAKQSYPHLSTGSVVMNHLIGGTPNRFGVPPCPGLPRGKILQLYGHASCGKTTFALTAAATTIAAGGTCVYIDFENEIAPDYARALGVPIGDASRFLLVQPDTLEEGMRYLWIFASGGVDLLVIDSVAAGVPQDIFNQKIEKVGELGRLGLIAAKWGMFLPKFKRQCAKTGAAVIGISQMRENIGASGNQAQTKAQGGQAWTFYPALRMKLARVQVEKGKQYDAVTAKMEEKVYGGKIKAKLDKCKVSAAQGQEAFFYIRQGYGIDDVRSVMDIAQAHKILKKSGAWYSWTRANGDEIRGQGTDKFRKLVLETEGAEQELYKVTLPFLASGGDHLGPPEEDEDQQVQDELVEIDELLADKPKEDEGIDEDAGVDE